MATAWRARVVREGLHAGLVFEESGDRVTWVDRASVDVPDPGGQTDVLLDGLEGARGFRVWSVQEGGHVVVNCLPIGLTE